MRSERLCGFLFGEGEDGAQDVDDTMTANLSEVPTDFAGRQLVIQDLIHRLEAHCSRSPKESVHPSFQSAGDKALVSWLETRMLEWTYRSPVESLQWYSAVASMNPVNCC